MNSAKSSIPETIQALKQLVPSESDSVGIVVETAQDESMLVGTREGVIGFVIGILEALERSSSSDFNRLTGTKFRDAPVLVKGLYFPQSEICITSLGIVSSQSEARELIDYFLRVNPPSPPNAPPS